MTMESLILNLLENFGFPAFVTAILLYDKIKSNGSLLKVVENNSRILDRIQRNLENCE